MASHSKGQCRATILRDHIAKQLVLVSEHSEPLVACQALQRIHGLLIQSQHTCQALAQHIRSQIVQRQTNVDGIGARYAGIMHGHCDCRWRQRSRWRPLSLGSAATAASPGFPFPRRVHRDWCRSVGLQCSVFGSVTGVNGRGSS
jgi:hypothetical protein